MAFNSSSFPAGIEKALSNVTALDSESLNSSSSHAAVADVTPTMDDAKGNELLATSTVLTVGITAASMIAIVVVLFVVCLRRRDESTLSSPISRRVSVFQGVTTTTASKRALIIVTASTPSTGVASPRPPLLHTFKMSGLSTEEVSVDHFALGADDSHRNKVLDAPQAYEVLGGPQTPQETSEATAHATSFSMFSKLRSSLPSFAILKTSHASPPSDIKRETIDIRELTTSLAQTEPSNHHVKPVGNVSLEAKQADAWRYRSDTCWSIDPGSDSETEIGGFKMPTHFNALNRAVTSNQRFDTNADSNDLALKDAHGNSLDQFSCLEDLVVYLSDCRGLYSASNAESETYSFVGSNFSTSLDYYGDSMSEYGTSFFDDVDSESFSSSFASGHSIDLACVREEEF